MTALPPWLLPVAGLALVLWLAGLTLAWQAMLRHERVVGRLRGPVPGAPSASGLTATALGLAVLRQRWLPASLQVEARRRFAALNRRAPHEVGLVIAAQGASAVLLPVLVVLVLAMTGTPVEIIATATPAAIFGGLCLPGAVLGHLHRRRCAAIDAAIPEFLDLLGLCLEAGLPPDAAMMRVAADIAGFHAALADELRGASDSIRLGGELPVALSVIADRYGNGGLHRLAAMLAQAMQYGTPLAVSLQALAEEIWQERMNKVEMRAAQLPVQLMVPMVVFILPPLFLLLVGPAVLLFINQVPG